MISNSEATNVKYYNADRSELVEFIRSYGHYPSALDIGCAAGILGVSLVRAGVVGACDGIEPNPEAAVQAGGRLRRVWQGEFETVAEAIPWASYDLIVLADVLEHLVDPWAALRRLHALTGPDCRLLLSVPNVRHYKVLLPLLLRGEFRYEDHGIMDRTHLHFFTRASLIDTMTDCGWCIDALGSHMKSRYRRPYMPTRLIESFVAVQYMVLGRKR